MPETVLFQWAVTNIEVPVEDPSEDRLEISAIHAEGYSVRFSFSGSPGPQISEGTGGGGNPDSITLTDTYT